MTWRNMTDIRRDDRLKGKVAIVTGAGSRAEGIGNGRATAVILARHGARVTLVDTVAQWAEETRRLIEAEGGVCQIVEGDVSDPASCQAIVARTVDAWGRLDILVNNVGITGPRGNAVEVDLAAWDSAMRVNVASMMLMAKYAIPEMIKSGGGSIINLVIGRGLAGRPSQPAVSDLQGRHRRAYARDGGASRPRRHPRQLHRAGHGLHADGCLARHDAGTAQSPQRAHAARHRRHRLGYRLWRAVSGQRRIALGHRHHAADRRRRHRRQQGLAGAAERAGEAGEVDAATSSFAHAAARICARARRRSWSASRR